MHADRALTDNRRVQNSTIRIWHLWSRASLQRSMFNNRSKGFNPQGSWVDSMQGRLGAPLLVSRTTRTSAASRRAASVAKRACGVLHKWVLAIQHDELRRCRIVMFWRLATDMTGFFVLPYSLFQPDHISPRLHSIHYDSIATERMPALTTPERSDGDTQVVAQAYHIFDVVSRSTAIAGIVMPA
eukprot:SAG31_NODE_16837_length_693_cov_1.552189_2_plen_184_part_01